MSSENNQDINWNFEDVKFYLTKLHNNKYSKSDVLPIVEDILSFNEFTAIENVQLRDLLKTYFKINKQEQNEILKNNELTHIQIADDYLNNHFDRKNIVYCEGSLYHYKNDIFNLYPNNSLESVIGRIYSNCYYCKRTSDYKSISDLVLREITDDNFFNNVPIGLAAKSHFYTIKNSNFKRLSYTKELKQRYKLNYDPDFKSDMPMFKHYLNTTFPNDMIQQNALQEIFGSIITGCANSFQKIFLLYGNGDNGKSTFLDILKAAIPRELQTFVMPDKFIDQFYMVNLANKLVNIGSDVQDVVLPPNFKVIISSDNELMCRKLFKDTVNFKSFASHIYSANKLMQTKDKTNGFFRRWLIIHFNNTIKQQDKIYNLADKIIENEIPQILAWGLEGVIRLYKQNHFTESEQHTHLLNLWKNNDNIHSFLFNDKIFTYNSDDKIQKSHLYPLYIDYCERNNQIPVSIQELSKIIKENFIIITIHGIKYLKGINLIK